MKSTTIIVGLLSLCIIASTFTVASQNIKEIDQFNSNVDEEINRGDSKTSSDYRSDPRTIYVDDDNSEGPWDGSYDYPYAHIQDALYNADSGDTVFVFQGDYEFYWDIVIDIPRLKLIGEDRDTTKILLGVHPVYGSPSSEPVKILADEITFRNFTIQSTLSYPYVHPMLYKVFYVQSNRNIIVNNKIVLAMIFQQEPWCWDGWTEYGIYLESSSGNIIQDNYFPAWIAWGGIAAVDGSNNNVISNNIINNKGELPETTIFTLDAGIYIEESSDNIVSGNIITPDTSDYMYRSIYCGIHLVNAQDNAIRKNSMINNGEEGIKLESSSSNLIIGNDIQDGVHWGGISLLGDSILNQFTRNTITNTVSYGVTNYAPTSANLFYHNNILVFLHSANDEGVNQWDYNAGGNYWIDYTGSDTNGDGIGEDPYLISGGDNQDNFPYVNESGWPNLPPTQPNSPNPANGADSVSITPQLAWSGSDPDEDDIVTYDVYFGTTNPPEKLIYNQSWSTFSPSQLQEETTYYWKIIAWDTSDERIEGVVWSFTTGMEEIPDTTDPIITFSSPESSLYFKGNQLFNTFKPIIIGHVNIVAEAYDEHSGVERVEFYDGDTLLGIDMTDPYGFMWDDSAKYNFHHTLRIVAYDLNENSASDEVDVVEFW